MTRAPFALAAVLFAGTAMAQAVDPLESTECRHALASLQARERVVAVARQGGGPLALDGPLLSLRRQAARICLGGDAPAAPQRAARPPIVVPPVAVARPALPLQSPSPPLGPALPPLERDLVVTACDAGGCWASDGSRLQRIGSSLLGPRGLCSVHGTVLRCP